VKLALENNEKLKGAGYGIEAAQGQVTEARAAFWPIFEYEYRMGPVPTDASRAFDAFFEGELAMLNRVRVAIGFPLFASGQIQTATRMAKNGVAASVENQTKDQESTVYQIKQAYNGILLAHELQKLLTEAIDKINNELKKEETEEIPTHSPYDLLKLKEFRTDMERRRAEVEQNKDLALEGLKIQLGIDPEMKVRLADDVLKPIIANLSSLENYVQASLEHRPEFHLLDLGVDTKKMQYRLEKEKLGPQAGFAFFMEVGRTNEPIQNLKATDDYNDPFNFTRAGLGLQISGKLDFHGAAGRLKKAKAEYFKSVYDRMIATKGLILEVRRAYLSAKRQHDNVTRARKAESMARQMMFLSKVNYDIGIGEEKDYTDALQLVLLTRGAYFQAIFDYNIAMADLEQKVGRINYQQLTPNLPLEEYEMFKTDEPEDVAAQ
jgi:outer membrane protein TolC